MKVVVGVIVGMVVGIVMTYEGSCGDGCEESSGKEKW